MSAPTAQRYVDLDLRIDPTLIGVAIVYATQYRGEWDVMVAARDLALDTGTLPLSIARLVLNCARMDPRFVGRLPAPQSATFTGAFPAPDDTESDSGDADTDDDAPVAPRATERPRRPHRLRVVPEPDPEPEWRPVVNLRSSFPKRYASVSDPDERNVWHVLDPAGSTVQYNPNTGKYTPRLRWTCDPGWRGHEIGMHSGRGWRLTADPPTDMRMCRSCDRFLADPELADHERYGPLQTWWLSEQERLTAPEAT